MANDLNPIPNGALRQEIAERIRNEATQLAKTRAPVVTQTNNGAVRDALSGEPDAGGWIAAHDSFTKGLAHDAFGRVTQEDLAGLVSAINQDANVGSPAEQESPFPLTYQTGRPAEFDAALYDPGKVAGHAYSRPADMKPRGWESPLSGHVFDLEGADADQLAMPPAPGLGDPELTAEMAEVYGAAIIRDIPFVSWADDMMVHSVAEGLGALSYFKKDADGSTATGRRRLARLENGTALSHANLFRGSTPGAKAGPYISQFMYLGNETKTSGETNFPKVVSRNASTRQDALNRAASFGVPEMRAFAAAAGMAGDIETTTTDGLIRYGVQTIPQRFTPHEPGIDHMVEWQTWLDVQNGADRKGDLDLFLKDGTSSRFIATPRDLATYVHFDALYQAYLNATLLLLGAGVPTDTGLPEGPGGTRDAFATFGGPHILTLVCEVATRALKAVRRQKYNIHLRSRPEALAAALSLAWTKDEKNLHALGAQKDALSDMVQELGVKDGILETVAKHNEKALSFWTGNNWPEDHGPLGDKAYNALLPMAFPEGSPMHPSYGAGHATVAGACVTIVKAFFEMYQGGPDRRFSIYEVLGIKEDRHDLYHNRFPAELFGQERPLTVRREVWDAMDDKARDAVPFPTAVVPDGDNDHRTLKQISADLTIQQELDKLAANISIGRNFAGVHYYTDYYESLRMGERLAVSILQEQMLTYREPVSMRFTSFDGDHVMVVGTGGSRDLDDCPVLVWDHHGTGGDKAAFEQWWTRHAG